LEIAGKKLKIKHIPGPLGVRGRNSDNKLIKEMIDIDRYYLDGRKIKEELHLKLSEALIFADEDIKENWKIYQKDFPEGK